MNNKYLEFLYAGHPEPCEGSIFINTRFLDKLGMTKTIATEK